LAIVYNAIDAYGPVWRPRSADLEASLKWTNQNLESRWFLTKKAVWGSLQAPLTGLLISIWWRCNGTLTGFEGAWWHQTTRKPGKNLSLWWCLFLQWQQCDLIFFCWSTKLCAHHTHLPFCHKANKIVVRKSGWKLTSLSILTPSWNWPPTRCLFFVCCQHHIHKEFLLHMWCKFARSKRHLKCPCASQPQTNSSCIYCIITNLSCADEFSPMTPMKHCASSTKQQPPGWSGGTVLLKKVHTLSTKIIGIQSNHRFKCRNGWLCFSDRRAGTAMFIATIWTNVPLIRRLWIIRMILVNTHAI